MRWLGVDVGGTFTDLVLLDDESGEIRVAKRPSTPASPDDGVLGAVRETCAPGELAAVDYFMHGTTVGLNALLQPNPGRMALLTTQGFRDVLEVRRGDRGEPYNLFWQAPAPLVPRRFRFEVAERMSADGTPVTPLAPDDVRRAAAELAAHGIDSVAIVFLHAYANPAHELEALAELRAAGFAGHVSLSHVTSGEFREYERTCTTAVDAYVRRMVSPYLERLKTGLSGAGFDGTALIMRSGGGAMTFEEADARPFETIMSGPVAGVEGAAALAQEMGLPTVVTADVGGTSFDTSLIVEGSAHTLYEGSVNGLPLQAPWVDVRSIGAGGGSIAYVDPGGLLRVGPRSAGAVPGPACYDQGGAEPTVTDAMLLLGMLGTGVLANGAVLRRDAATAAFDPVADALGMSLLDAARGTIEIVTASMANVITEITVDQGQDPREATLVAFGGAGPQFATLLTGHLGLRTAVIPPYAGNFSAYGLLVADLVQSIARTRVAKVADESLAIGNTVLAGLFKTLHERADVSHGGRTTSYSAALDMRYVGQEHSITVDVPWSADGSLALSATELLARFTRQYEQTYGSEMDEQIEIITWRATVRTSLPRQARPSPTPDEPLAVDPRGTWPAYSFHERAMREFAVVSRASITDDSPLAGPAIVLEGTATTYLDAGFRAEAHSTGALVVSAVDEQR